MHQNQDVLLSRKRHLHTESKGTGHIAWIFGEFIDIPSLQNRGHSNEGSIVDDWNT